MKPRLLIIGSIVNEIHVQKAKSGNDYLSLEIEAVYTEKDMATNQLIDAKSLYRVLFFNERAHEIFMSFKTGDFVTCDCSLSSSLTPPKELGGTSFLNYSITGLRIERIRRFKVGHHQAPPPQQQQRPPAQQYQQPQQPAPSHQSFPPASSEYDDLPF